MAPSKTPEPAQPLHLVFLPFLARSHFGPLAAAAAAVAALGGATATVLTTPHFAGLVPPSVSTHLAPFPAAADFAGAGDFSLLPATASASAFLAAAESSLSPPLAALLRRLRPHGAVAVISDALFHWAPRLAGECGVPHVTFHTIGAFAAAALVALHLHRPKALPDPFDLPGGFPHQVRLHKIRVPEEAVAHLRLFRAAEAESYAVLFNSFAALEAECAKYYRALGPSRVFLVGPTCMARGGGGGGGGARHPTLEWLDGLPVGSVVYVCFGSTCALGASQLRALVAALEACGRPFLWVVPSEARGEHEERAAGRGMVTVGRWAPQADILAHRAVGGFVSHCGWNSVLESVSAGVAMATWPLRAEQFLNEELVVGVLRVGVRVREVAAAEDLVNVVPAEAVASAVERLMGAGEEAEERRARARELGEAARAAVADGGSSDKNWERLIQELEALRPASNPLDITHSMIEYHRFKSCP